MTGFPEAFGYAFAALAYSMLFLALLTIWRNRTRGSVLPMPCLAGAVWAAMLFRADATQPTLSLFLYEVLYDAGWLLLLFFVLRGAVLSSTARMLRLAGLVVPGLVVLMGFGLATYHRSFDTAGGIGGAWYLGQIILSVIGLLLVDIVYRNARETQRAILKYLVAGLLVVFAFDLYVFTIAYLQGGVVAASWNARGFLGVFSVVLVAVSASRFTGWSQGFFISRKVVAYGSATVLACLYLALIVMTGNLLKTYGPDWGAYVQVVFFVAALVMLALLFVSRRLRADLAVFVQKHFFEGRYDYRAEWLRLIETLTESDNGLTLMKRAVKSLAQVVGASSGQLWVRRQAGQAFEPEASWNQRVNPSRIDHDDEIVRFIRDSGWIIDLREARLGSGSYPFAAAAAAESGLAKADVLVPLVHEGELIGLVALNELEVPSTLNFEDHDLLKTAGKQVASFVAQQISSERLAEARQFEAYSRFTAYVMHDLKNAIAQQSLVVDNAEKHKRNPQFIDDAIETIKGSVERMRRVLRNLQQRKFAEPLRRVDLVALVKTAASECSDRSPAPSVSVPSGPVTVEARREQTQAAIVHAIRNAQDATPSNGEISIRIEALPEGAVVMIRDTGVGMDQAFINERLFRPFDSTKGAEGMGIGAYQLRETLRSIGGDVGVESSPGTGTTLTLSFPVAGSADDRARQSGFA